MEPSSRNRLDILSYFYQEVKVEVQKIPTQEQLPVVSSPTNVTKIKGHSPHLVKEISE